MKIYERKIWRKLFLLRLFLFFIVVSSVYALITDNETVLYISLVAFFLGSLFSLTGFAIDIGRVELTRYYLYGLITTNHVSKKNTGQEIQIVPHETYPETDTIVDLITLLFFLRRTGYLLSIAYDNNKGQQKRMEIIITDKEKELIDRHV